MTEVSDYITRYYDEVPHEGLLSGCMYSTLIDVETGMKYVAKQGGGGFDWAVYVQTEHASADTERIAAHGQKIIRTLAEDLFPEWAKVLSWRN